MFCLVYEHGDDACPGHLQLVGDLGGVTGVDGQRSGKLNRRGKSDDVNSIQLIHMCVLVCVAPPMVVVDGRSATAAI